MNIKNLFIAVCMGAIFASCNCCDSVKIQVANSTDIDRQNEMIEVDMSEIKAKLQLADTAQVIVVDITGNQVPYQITHDGKLIFQASVAPKGEAEYTIQPGTPIAVATLACGRHYPERVDDIAWENDRTAFRMYGPALQASGERAFGYDVWVKSVKEPVVEERYAKELNPETKAQIAKLKKTNPKAAEELAKSVSYHVDHGNGHDCYKVGPTLGGGASALVVDGEIVYPYCYKTYEILDNGPLRFTVKAVYNPTDVKGAQVVETRVISLDAGSQLNKTVVTYENLAEATPVVAGVVLHEPLADCGYQADKENGFLLYADPSDNVNNNNGVIYVGCVFPDAVTDVKPVMYDAQEAKDRGAEGQLLAYTDYQPGGELVYYWGSGWSKYGFETPEAWGAYMKNAAIAKRNPLKVSIR